ncbi:hypothetical protein C0993_010984, partial [Termitomyces sp. T159_Od127]
MAGSQATCVVPQVIIWTLPPQKPSIPPVDFYALMKQAVKQDTNNMIMAVLGGGGAVKRGAGAGHGVQRS